MNCNPYEENPLKYLTVCAKRHFTKTDYWFYAKKKKNHVNRESIDA
jgi:hypothetical protein